MNVRIAAFLILLVVAGMVMSACGKHPPVKPPPATSVWRGGGGRGTKNRFG